MDAAQRVGQAVAGGAGCDVIGVQGTAVPPPEATEKYFAVFDGPLYIRPATRCWKRTGLVELPVMEHWTSSFFMMATPSMTSLAP